MVFLGAKARFCFGTKKNGSDIESVAEILKVLLGLGIDSDILLKFEYCVLEGRGKKNSCKN